MQVLKARHCLDCNQELSGRSDKKFCSDQCRINFHNVLAQKTNKSIRKINKILLHNRKILRENIVNEQKQISMAELTDQGFNFKYHTHQIREAGKITTFSYDFGFKSLNRAVVEIFPINYI